MKKHARFMNQGSVHRRAVLATSLLSATLLFLSGCDTANPNNAVNPEAGQHVSTDGKCRERIEFEQATLEWRGVVGKLMDLNVECRVANATNADERKRQYDELVTRGNELQERMISSALVAYARRPADNRDLVPLLANIASMEVARDQYEPGLKIMQTLIDNGVETPALFNATIQTAINANEFELAAELLELQKKKGLADTGGMSDKLRRQVALYQRLWSPEKNFREAEQAADDLPRVKLRTNKGEIELELFENEAPNTVANFISLVEKGFYNGLDFYRVEARKYACVGCPNGDGTGGPGYRIKNELLGQERRAHFRGSVSLNNTGAAPGGSQLTFCLAPQAALNGRHTVFGRVVRGLDVLSNLQRRVPRDKVSKSINPHSNVVIPPADRIISTTVVRKRQHPYQPVVVK